MVCDELPLIGYTELNEESTAIALKTKITPDMCMKYTWTKDNVYPNERFNKLWKAYQEKVSELAKKIITLIRFVLNEEKSFPRIS
ncbi:hypothetical protein A8C32_08235 [Flavivirga aquatica]|uniref:Uncharacterized protein n=2 Tax=Flavivirga aquatica TaxID=1849968 RepID=A0A1E5SJ65_9FLAO|nr:hypothetical protein A8C32_08235 [Flavivirga aquatica]